MFAKLVFLQDFYGFYHWFGMERELDEGWLAKVVPGRPLNGCRHGHAHGWKCQTGLPRFGLVLQPGRHGSSTQGSNQSGQEGPVLVKWDEVILRR